MSQIPGARTTTTKTSIYNVNLQFIVAVVKVLEQQMMLVQSQRKHDSNNLNITEHSINNLPFLLSFFFFFSAGQRFQPQTYF